MCRGEVKITVHSALTILNAIPAWRGVAVGIQLPLTVTVRESREYLFRADDPSYIRFLVEKFEKKFNVKLPVEITVSSSIPPRSGLKSSSAVAVAVIASLAIIHDIGLTLRDCLLLAALWSKDYGVSVTGALDDAAACLLGGIVYTDNLRGEIVRQDSVKILNLKSNRALILIPRSWSKPSRPRIEKLRLLSRVYEKLFEKALRGSSLIDIAQVNSLLVSLILGYDIRLLKIIAERTGGTALLSGNGPAVVVLDYDESVFKRNLNVLSSLCNFTVSTKLRDLSFSPLDSVFSLASC